MADYKLFFYYYGNSIFSENESSRIKLLFYEFI
jgi:hypothetical protein